MDFVSIDDFLPDILPEVVGCSKYTAQDAVRLAVIEFCKTTGVSVETTEEIDLTADEDVLTLPTPSGQVESWQVLWMTTDEGTVWPMDRRTLAERNLIWRGKSGNRPQSYTVLNRKQVRFIPTPDTDVESILTVHQSFIPKNDASRVDARLFDEYREAITAGALSRLLKQSGTGWYDPKEALERKAFFVVEMSQARGLAAKDFQTGEKSVQMNPMA